MPTVTATWYRIREMFLMSFIVRTWTAFASKYRIRQAGDLLEMAVGGQEVRAVFHRLGGDPDVVDRYRASVFLQLHDDPRIPVGGDFAQRGDFHRLVAKEPPQPPTVILQ